MRTVAVVGTSLAGLRAIEALRREGYDGAVVAIGAEPHLPYDRPPLSKELLAGLSEPDMLADELHLLLEGARVTAQSVGADGLGARLVRMGEAMITAHAPRQ